MPIRKPSHRLRPRALWPALVVVAGMAACEPAREPGPAASPIALRLERTIVADTGPAAFGRVVDLELGEDGEVIVLDGLNRAVQVFDREGRHLRTMGRRGSGPGELENPSSLFIGPEGRIWVIDPGNLRYTVYDLEGDSVATYARPTPGFSRPWRGAVSPHGTVYDIAFGLSLEDGPRPTLQEVAVDTGELRVLRQGDVPTMEAAPGYRFTGGNLVLMLAVPFAPQPVFQVGPAGDLWYGRTDHPWLYRRVLSRGEALVPPETADSVRVILAGTEPPPVTRAELDSILSSDDLRELRALGGQGAVSDFLELIPAHKPAYEDFFFDDGGRLWVVRTGDPEGVRLDVFDPAGVHVGGVTAGMEASPRPRVKGGWLAGVARDEYDVERVVVYGVER